MIDVGNAVRQAIEDRDKYWMGKIDFMLEQMEFQRKHIVKEIIPSNNVALKDFTNSLFNRIVMDIKTIQKGAERK